VYMLVQVRPWALNNSREQPVEHKFQVSARHLRQLF
jgi:hypothetical protein